MTHPARRLGILKYKQWVPFKGEEQRIWQLGIGPCGKTVIQLWATTDDKFLRVFQYCEGQREPDLFLIPLSEISGAIQMFPEQQGPKVDNGDDFKWP